MYMLTNYGGSGLQVVAPDPPGAGGAAINANFKALATMIAAADPGVDDDASAGFGVGSRWYNSATSVEWICLSSTPGDAEWAAITAGSMAGYLPLAGGTMAGALSMGGNGLNMNAGGGGATLNMDGGAIANAASVAVTGAVQFPDISVSEVTPNSMIGIGFSGTTVIVAYPSGSSNPAGIYMGGNTGSGGNVLWMEGGTLNMSTGGGTGGATLNMDGGTLNLSNGGGSGGNTLNVDGGTLNMGSAGTINLQGGTLNLDGTATISSSSGTVTFGGFGILSMGAIYYNNSGNWNFGGIGEVNMNGGGGSDGTVLNMDGGLINFNPDGSTPTNTSTPAGWIKIQINGGTAYLPYYT